ncbi:hypothetical protein [Mucilaginibacter paludis]|uniref:Uncharacterized protein n=1 Tax=Mucilaginibacter paludis DSM 18603 TaxID=714943 RepID=H1YH56_9SPHI|nr:hypothetical protein [Mucilaginibacter paludis]EHQ24558.1 hypothetical protein Mucpa_0362 [Mucilaginibacter paludis DSM 18603]
MLITKNTDLYKQNLDRQLQEISEQITDNIQTQLRQRFNATTLDSSAQACINYARLAGFTTLAAEMQKDYDNEIYGF